MNKAQELLEILLDESPRVIELEKIPIETAKQVYIDLNKDKRRKILETPYPNAELIQVGNKFAVLDHNLKQITYYMSWDYKRVKRHKVVFQSMVWRLKGREDAPTEFIPRKVFWNYLFPIANAVATDRIQTDLGKGFWTNILPDVFNNKHLNVYYFDGNTNVLRPLSSEGEVIDLSKEIWGDHKRNERRLVVISKDPIS